MFDLAKYITSAHIEHHYNRKGTNVYIRCPFCVDDPSRHMGINVTTGFWGCWRNKDHSGSSPHRLLEAVFRLTRAEAQALIDAGKANLQGWDAIRSGLQSISKSSTPSVIRKVDLPPEVRPLSSIVSRPVSGLQAAFVSSLRQRGFNPADLEDVCNVYDLGYALSGSMAGRIVIPIYYGGELVAYTGRSIYRDADLRYYSLPADATCKQLVYGYDAALEGGRALAVVEGPFDRIKFDYYARAYGVHTVASLGTALTERQVSCLASLVDRFDQLWWLLDGDALAVALRLQGRISSVYSKVLQVTPVKDPGEMTPAMIHSLCRKELE